MVPDSTSSRLEFSWSLASSRLAAAWRTWALVAPPVKIGMRNSTPTEPYLFRWSWVDTESLSVSL
ncbi:hypothetical protein D3C79_1015990 [compost metagenome]